MEPIWPYMRFSLYEVRPQGPAWGCADGCEGAAMGTGASEVRRYQEDGYLAVDRLAADGEVDLLAQLCSSLVDRRAGDGEQRFFNLAGPTGQAPVALPQVLYPEREEPRLLETEFFAYATALGTRLMGRDDLDWFTHFIVKPARWGAPTPWHQDVGYDPDLRRPGCSVWLALDEATADSGCLQFLPGSHRGPIMQHRPIAGDQRARGLEAVGVDPAGAASVPARRGGGSVHDHRVLHGAGPNTSPAVRRAYIVVGIVRANG
jgi:hypothetical protein